MNSAEEQLLARLESMTLSQARVAIHTRTLGNTFDSSNHEFCLSWLAAKDAELRSEREAATARWARHAAYAAYAAAAIAATSIAITIWLR